MNRNSFILRSPENFAGDKENASLCPLRAFADYSVYGIIMYLKRSGYCPVAGELGRAL